MRRFSITRLKGLWSKKIKEDERLKAFLISELLHLCNLLFSKQKDFYATLGNKRSEKKLQSINNYDAVDSVNKVLCDTDKQIALTRAEYIKTAEDYYENKWEYQAMISLDEYTEEKKVVTHDTSEMEMESFTLDYNLLERSSHSAFNIDPEKKDAISRLGKDINKEAYSQAQKELKDVKYRKIKPLTDLVVPELKPAQKKNWLEQYSIAGARTLKFFSWLGTFSEAFLYFTIFKTVIGFVWYESIFICLGALTAFHVAGDLLSKQIISFLKDKVSIPKIMKAQPYVIGLTVICIALLAAIQLNQNRSENDALKLESQKNESVEQLYQAPDDKQLQEQIAVEKTKLEIVKQDITRRNNLMDLLGIIALVLLSLSTFLSVILGKAIHKQVKTVLVYKVSYKKSRKEMLKLFELYQSMTVEHIKMRQLLGEMFFLLYRIQIIQSLIELDMNTSELLEAIKTAQKNGQPLPSKITELLTQKSNNHA